MSEEKVMHYVIDVSFRLDAGNTHNNTEVEIIRESAGRFAKRLSKRFNMKLMNCDVDTSSITVRPDGFSIEHTSEIDRLIKKAKT